MSNKPGQSGRPPADALDLDRDACYRALVARDSRFDGRFYTAVLSTGIYCRPICPARTPKLENCLFLPTAAAAHQMGFRPCLRCRPEAAPGLAVHRGSANTVSRALCLIAEGALDQDGIEQLASRLGVGGRHLRRLFDRHVGASPIAVAQAHRILFAKTLIDGTVLPMTEIALAAGFGSIRRFNEVFRRAYGRPPHSLRRHDRTGTLAAGITLTLPFSPPYDWPAMLDFLRGRAIPSVESVEEGRYLRSFVVGSQPGWVEVSHPKDANHLLATIHAEAVSVLSTVVARLRRLFDLDADIAVIDAHLAADPRLAERVRQRPGLRVPGAWDAFELAVRAILGQQVSVAAATTFAGRLAGAFGRPLPQPAAAVTRLFPQASVIAEADLTGIGLTRSRAQALQSLARSLGTDPALLTGGDSLDDTVARLGRLPGIGPWTAHYIAMRALREPDAFPAADLGLLRAMETADGRPTPKALLQMAEAWRPWRAYAALRLWIQE
ncbi:AlkA N-terminal domain-containing protein [Telmatospirillum sp.]|uniref:AlkA N-terminal domain-containing protein n=1 Tax=Telmatospirillum sp. TaxID=2079197 RepID=UPI00284A0A79|nr:AlkA N-terminal domain-containing protein [Telmatospirillum sp.]MDR3439381.1 AlkA N-terminal domain-containing protein [Telmatospirillum sp.]